MQVGLNLSSNVDWQTGRFWLDLKNVLRPWGLWTGKTYALNADGYPTTDFTGFAELRNYPPGIYQFTYTGDGVLKWSQGVSADSRTDPRAKIGAITLIEDGGLTFSVTGVTAANPFRGLSIRKGLSGTGVFDPDFVASVKPYPVLRFMDWQHTNYPAVREWSDRPLPKHQQTVAPGVLGKGVALEYCLDLCLAAGSSPWLCIPHTASDNYVREMAAFVAGYYGTDKPVYLEYSNEVWNGQFMSHMAVLADAGANAALDASDPNARIAQQVAYKLASAVTAFRAAGVNVVGVYATQADNGAGTPDAGWLAVQGLDYLKRKGSLSAVGVLSYADYFYLNSDGPNPPVATLLKRSGDWCRLYRGIADRFGVPRLAVYEGGQNLIGADQWKRDMQTSTVMGSYYRAVFAQFSALSGPNSLWCAFASPASWKDGQDGYWGLSEKLGATTPKLDAVLAAATQSPPVVPPSPPPPGVQPLSVVVTADGKEVCRYDGPRAGVVAFTVTNRD